MTSEELCNKYRNIRSKIPALADLDEVDWHSLHHAHGEASDFPILINAALSVDAKDRQFALRLLYETIWHQGTIYQATAFAVPFIVKLIQSRDISNQVDFAMLFATIAQGEASFVHGFKNEKDEKMWQEIYAHKGWDLHEKIKDNIKWNLATKEVSQKNLLVLYPYLNYQDGFVREYIAEVLSCYPELGFETLPLLESRISIEEGKDVKIWLEKALHKLKESVKE